MPHQRPRGAARLFSGRRRGLRLLELGQPAPLPVFHNVHARRIAGADVLRNDGRARLGRSEFGRPVRAVLSPHFVERDRIQRPTEF